MARTTMGHRASIWPWLAWALLILIADQFTKTLILGYYQLGDATYVTSFFNIVRAHDVEEAGDVGGVTELVVAQDQRLGELVGDQDQQRPRQPGPDAGAVAHRGAGHSGAHPVFTGAVQVARAAAAQRGVLCVVAHICPVVPAALAFGIRTGFDAYLKCVTSY